MNTPTTIPATETLKLSVLKADTAYQGSLLKENSHWQALCTAPNVFLEPLNLPNYGERVEAIEERFGPAAALLILLGNFNYQVSNGGHDQYFHNGYADGVGGFFQNHDSSIPLHKRMTELFRQLKFYHLPQGREMLAILEAFRIELDEERQTTCTCDTCGGSGESDEEGEECADCDGHGTVECQNEEYGQVSNSHELDGLDTRYYSIMEVWEKAVEAHLAAWLSTEEDPLANAPVETIAAAYQKPNLKLVGENGNALNIMGLATRALREAGAPKEVIEQYRQRAMSGDYDNVLRTTMEFCEVR